MLWGKTIFCKKILIKLRKNIQTLYFLLHAELKIESTHRKWTRVGRIETELKIIQALIQLVNRVQDSKISFID